MHSNGNTNNTDYTANHDDDDDDDDDKHNSAVVDGDYYKYCYHIYIYI